MLYICSTPIGNLGDITLRALETLKNADVVACESITHTRGLLSHFNIHAQLMSFREENRQKASEEILKLLEVGKSVVLVTDAGTPAVSDPGFFLVDKALSAGYEVTSLPGASSLLASIVLSGFSADSFLFLGFLPRKNTKRNAVYEEIAFSSRTCIFFESPHRFIKTLKELDPFVENRRICVTRELTKKFEEVLRGSCSEIISLFEEKKIQGEFVILVEGSSDEKEESASADFLEEKACELLMSGVSPKIAVRELQMFSKNKKELYSLVLKIKNKLVKKGQQK